MRKIFLLLLICATIFSSVPVGAIEPEKLITEAYTYTANLYYCDGEGNKIVLKNVKPVGELNPKKSATAQEAEYKEIYISCMGLVGDGQMVPQEYMNIYADGAVKVIIVRSVYEGLRVVGLKFI